MSERLGIFGKLLKPVVTRWIEKHDALILRSKDGFKIEIPFNSQQKPKVQNDLIMLLDNITPGAEKPS